MLILPKSLNIERNKEAEAGLIEKTRKWLEHDSKDRTGIHASDLLDPRQAYFNKRYPHPLSDRMVGTFFVGKTLHAFFLSAFTGATGTDWKTDGGSHENKELGITWSADWIKNGVPYEFKTSRSKYEQSPSDLKSYLEQLLIYMVGTGSTTGKLITLMYNLPAPRGQGWGSFPQYRAYDISITQKDLDAYKLQLKKTVKLLTTALKKKSHKDLPLCREFKCMGCPHFEKCKPEGRYGKKRFKPQ
jgi:hypothetical protein